MRRRTASGWIAAAGVLLACAGCGFKGPLYLPERNATVVTHPARNAKEKGKPSAASQQTPPPTPAPPSPVPPTPRAPVLP